MRLRGLMKKLIYGTWPRSECSFPYFGSRVFFPKSSIVFNIACKDGIYEWDVVRFVNRFLLPGTTYIDIGANIGLMSVAALANNADCKVVSVEASPNALRCLLRTHAANVNRRRWTIIPKAIGAEPGDAIFFDDTDEGGALGGLRHTGRGGARSNISVPVTTIDRLWEELGRPVVSVMKIDVEGGEYDALAGASDCLAANRPAVVIEWSRLNFPAYGVAEDVVLNIARQRGYAVFSVPGFAEVSSAAALSLHMLETETFALMPKSSGDSTQRPRSKQ